MPVPAGTAGSGDPHKARADGRGWAAPELDPAWDAPLPFHPSLPSEEGPNEAHSPASPTKVLLVWLRWAIISHT